MDAKSEAMGNLIDQAWAQHGEPTTSSDVEAPPPSRSRRKRAVRARTINVLRETKQERELARWLYPDASDVVKPAVREDCDRGVRPCPFVSCKHHLYLDVSPRTGAIKLNFPDLEPWEVEESCALDVADRGGATLEDVGAIMNVTRERIRQVEVMGLAKLEARGDAFGLYDQDEVRVRKRRLPMLADAKPASAHDGEEVAFDVDAFASPALDAE